MHDLVAELDVVRNADQPSDGFPKIGVSETSNLRVRRQLAAQLVQRLDRGQGIGNRSGSGLERQIRHDLAERAERERVERLIESGGGFEDGAGLAEAVRRRELR